MKYIKAWLQESPWTQAGKRKEDQPRHVRVKPLKTKDEERESLKKSQAEKFMTLRKARITTTADFSSEIMDSTR